MSGAAIGRSSGEVDRALRSTPTARRSTLTAVGWTVLVALVWVLLAAWRPSTTWHLAPVLLGGAAPWVVGQDLRGGDRSAIPRVVAAAVAGAAVSALVTWALWSGGLLAGPTVLGFPGPAIEAFTFAGVASVLALLLGGARAQRRRPTAWTAWHGPTRVAVSEDVVVVEGNAYFPPSAVRAGVLSPGDTRTLCPWKGVARYYTLNVDGIEVRDAAWSYAYPLPLARRIKGRFAFAEAVEVWPAEPAAAAEPPAPGEG